MKEEALVLENIIETYVMKKIVVLEKDPIVLKKIVVPEKEVFVLEKIIVLEKEVCHEKMLQKKRV